MKNESGFSILETMISAGLLGMVVLAVSNITKDIGRVERKVNFDTSSAAVFIQIRSAIRNKAGCEKTLAGKTPGEVDAIYFENDDAFKVLEKDKTYRGGGGADEKGTGQGGITIQEIRVHGPPADPSDPFPPPPSSSPNFTSNPPWKGSVNNPVWAYITFTYTKMGEKGATTTEQRMVPVLITTDSSTDGSPIKTCYTDLDSYVSAVCSSLNGIMDKNDPNFNDPTNDPKQEPYPCKNIAVEQKLGSELQSGHHNFAILAKGDIRVGKSLGVGIEGEDNPVDPQRSAPSGKNEQKAYATNHEIGEVKAAKDVKFDGSAHIKNDMGVGLNHEIQSSGNLRINQALTIGPANTPNSSSKGLRIHNFLGVGSSPIAPAIAGAPTSGQGHMVVLDPTASQQSKVIVGPAWDNGVGVNDPSGQLHSLVSDGLIYIEANQTQGNVTANHVITKGYFKEQLRTTLKNPFDTLGNQINSSLENATNVQVYNIIRSAICNYELKIDTRVGGVNCNNYQSGMYKLTSTKSGGQNQNTIFSLFKTTSPSSSTKNTTVSNCAKSGTCSRVCIGSNCRTTFRSSCPTGFFAVGISRGGTLACARDSY
ncbi:MAG: hypothetical protein OEY33_00355 [Bdellovibrionales bacterium]|nr:hypothetical protein [Bdellovibrionales bacterium]